ncbi:hypothetical protein AVEN_186207-1 [Araneus ventricosus]|uniref:Uncharacterized protein n=1 Tax=Araneus ventricosus TaxID=182803 RepID=A0A4Y2B4D6_ARAVE|nr:hypothetical protein AVEN_255940-1 [Araneus ventricosus]GBL86175.1 hypothetical protein AVEN_186207-1 [Araneus ventricosus]
MFTSCLSKHHPVCDILGSLVYGSDRPSYLKRLDYVHHQTPWLCLRAFRTSPIPSLYAEAFEPSLSCRRDKLSLLLLSYSIKLPPSFTWEIIKWQ